MFTNLTITSEIARQRQSVLITRSDRQSAVRRSVAFMAETCGAVIGLPARKHAATSSASADGLVA